MTSEQSPQLITLDQLTDEMERRMTPDGAVYLQTLPKRVKIGDTVLVKMAERYWGHEKVVAIDRQMHCTVIQFESGVSERVFPNDRLTVLIQPATESLAVLRRALEIADTAMKDRNVLWSISDMIDQARKELESEVDG